MAETKPDKNKETKSPLGKKPNTPKVPTWGFFGYYSIPHFCAVYFSKS